MIYGEGWENVSSQLEPHLPMNSAIARDHGFVFHKKDAPHIIGEVEGYSQQPPEEMFDLPRSAVLHTSQTGFGKWGLSHYAKVGYDHTQWDDDEGYTAPQVYKHKGKLWVAEGHHRILASRLRNESSTPVHFHDHDAYDHDWYSDNL